MRVEIKAATIKGAITIPGSKSAMQRACAAALLNKGNTFISQPGISNDDQAALSIIRQLGAHVSEVNGQLRISSNGIESIRATQPETLHCGESGLSIRMFTPIAALNEHSITIDGEGSLRKRPMHFFEEVFPALEVSIRSTGSCVPLQIKGPLKTKNIKVDGSKSSQYITGLMMAFSAVATTETTVEIADLKSKPYVDLTLSIMQHFGMNVPQNDAYQKLIFQPAGTQQQKDIHYTVEADWSSASFLLAAGAINGDLTIKGLDINSTQADKAMLQALKLSGADMQIEESSIFIKTSALQAFEFDATDCPDLFPPLVALAAHSKGISRIKGVSRLIHKESNRQQSLETEFSKMGLHIYSEEDYMIIEGGTPLQGTHVSSHNDHRIAMALSVAALNVSGKTTISEANAIKKSYPDFYSDLQQLGATVILEQT